MIASRTERSALRVGAYVEDIIFPCTRADLMDCAEDNDAPDLILDAIENLPEKRFENMEEILICIQSDFQ